MECLTACHTLVIQYTHRTPPENVTHDNQIQTPEHLGTCIKHAAKFDDLLSPLAMFKSN
jgi:hypothetical protein